MNKNIQTSGLQTRSDPMAKQHPLVVTGVVFSVFFAEALIHYALGESQVNGRSFWSNLWEFPSGEQLLRMAAIVMIASSISTILITTVENKFGKSTYF